MKVSKALTGISRRDLFRLSGQFGLSSVVLGAGALTGAVSLPSLARAAESTYEKRFGKEPKHTLTLGASGFNAQNLLIERAGVLEFARDLEERTEGEIRVEFIGDNQICGQLNCVDKTQQGVIDMYATSTQNSAGGAPYLTCSIMPTCSPAGRRSITSSTARNRNASCASRWKNGMG